MDDNVIDYKKIGQRLRERRINKSWTQEKVAAQCNMTLNYYQRIESNNAKLSLTALVKVCQALECSIDYVLSDTITPPNNEINPKMLNEIEKKFIVNTIKNLKEVELN